MVHSYTNILIHYVFSTKNWEKIMTIELQKRLRPYMGGIARENNMKALAIGGIEDHVHLLILLPTTLSTTYGAVMDGFGRLLEGLQMPSATAKPDLVALETNKFNMALQKVIMSVGESVETVVRTAALELMRRTMKGWPVDTGRSRASWTPLTRGDRFRSFQRSSGVWSG